MPDGLVFMMGEHEAAIPADRGYAPSHFWLQADGAGRYRVGLTAFALRLLRDVHFLEWTVPAEAVVAAKQEVGIIESSKAVSGVYAPFAGVVERFNPAALADPSLLNTDGYGAGWLFAFRTEATLLDAAGYLARLHETWDETQRHIKKQMTAG